MYFTQVIYSLLTNLKSTVLKWLCVNTCTSFWNSQFISKDECDCRTVSLYSGKGAEFIR